MKIECPSCHLTGTVNELEFPPGGRDVSCPRCRTSFHVETPADMILMNVCPACQYSTFSDEMFSVCPQCGVTGKEALEKKGHQQREVERHRQDAEAMSRSFRNPDLVKAPAEDEPVEVASAPQPVRVTGTVSAAAGAAILGYGLYGLSSYYGKDWQAILSEPLMEPVSRTEVFFRLGFVPWTITLFGSALLAVGSLFALMRPWSWKGLRACAWAGMGVVLIREAVNYADWVRISTGAPSFFYYVTGLLSALLMIALWGAPFLALLWVLHTDDIINEFPID